MISYGYNYTAFSPIKQIGTGGLFNQPIYGYATVSLTAADKPAETVLLARDIHAMFDEGALVELCQYRCARSSGERTHHAVESSHEYSDTIG